LAFSIVEGVFFSGAFCSIFWLKNRGILMGLAQANEFISRDESLHTEFAVYLYRHVLLDKHKPAEEEAECIVREAVDIEIEFITEALPCRLIGIGSDSMSQYVRFVADRLMLQLGYRELDQVANPFSWMEKINVSAKVDFFKGKNTEYSLKTVSKSLNITEAVFDSDD